MESLRIKAKTLNKKSITAIILAIIAIIMFFLSIIGTGMQSLGSVVIGESNGGEPLRFNVASGKGSVNGVVAAEVPVLMVSLDHEDGPYLSMTNGYEDMISHYGNWLPASGNMLSELAFVSDKAASNINVNSANDKIKLGWYNSGADNLLMSSDSEKGWQNSILTKYTGAGNGSDPTGGNGVYRTKLNELKASGKLRDWRTLVNDSTMAQSKKLWGSFAQVTSTGSSYSWDVSGKIKNYMQLNSLDLDNLASWSAEDSNKASIAYMDLLMTLYSCSTGTPDNAAQWESAVDRYVNNGFAPGKWKCNENIILYPGLAIQVNGGSGDRVVLSCGDAWNYAYHVNTEYSLGLKDIAINKYGKLGLSDVYSRLYKATTDNRNAYPNGTLYLNSGNFSYGINFSFAKKIRLSDWQMENVSNTRRFIESLYMTGKDGTKYYGINVIPSIPMEVTSTSSSFDIDFDVIWSNKRAKHLVTKGQTVNDVAQLRLNMKVPESEKSTWETLFEKYTDFEIAFDVKSDTSTGRETRTTKTDGGNTSPLSTAGYQVDGRDYTNNTRVKIDKTRLKSLLWGYTTFDSLYEYTTKPQSINYAELQQYGYDVTVTIYYKNNTSAGSSIKSNTVGFSKDTTDGQRAKHKVTAYREEDPNRKVTYYSDPEAFSEIKEGTVERNNTGSQETWEAMAGVPSTETLYFTSGGSEFIVELELEFVEGEQAERKYTQTFFGTECEFKRGDQFKPIKASGNSSSSGFSNSPTIAKEKFTTDLNGFDTGNIDEKDAEWYQGFKPEGSASATYNLQGHNDTPKKADGTSVVNGTSYQQDNQAMDSTTITATWTGQIKNNQGTKSEQAPSSSHINNYVQGSPAPSCKGGSDGYAGDFNEKDTKWDDSKYIEAVKQAEQWAKAYESTNATYTAKKLSTGDQNTRIWKVGNATISVSFSGGNSNQGSGSRPAGAYTTGNVRTAYTTQNTNPGYWGYNFSFSHGTDGVSGTHGDSDDGGDPPKTIPHGDDQDGTATVGSTVNAVGDINYTVKVTFDNGTYDAHELCGPCCQHNLPQIFDSWTQKSQYDYARINTMRVYKIHRSYVDGMEDITFVDYNDAEDLKHTSKSETLIQDLGKGVPWMHGALDSKTKVLSPAEQAKKHNGTDTIVAAISQGDPNIFYNIANEADYYAETSGSNKLSAYPSRAGRVRYSFQPQEHDNVYLEEISRRGNSTWASGYECEEGSRSNKCDGLMRTSGAQNPVKVVGKGHENPDVVETAGLYEGAINKNCFSNGMLYSNGDFTYDQVWMQTLTQSNVPSCNSIAVDGTAETAGRGRKKQAYDTKTIDDKDYLTEEYHRMRYRRNMTTEMYIVSDMLLLQTSSGDQPVMYYVAPSQTKRLQQHFDYKESDKYDNPAGEFKGTLLKNDFKNMWSNNPTCANNWGANNLGQDGDVNVGSYLGLGSSDPDDKFSDTSKHQFQFGTIFDNTGGVKTLGDLDTGCGHLLRFVDGNYEGYGLPATFGANKPKSTDKYLGRKMNGYEPLSSVVTPGGKSYWEVDNKTDWVEDRPGGYGAGGWRDITDSWYIASPSMRYHDTSIDMVQNSYGLSGERRKPRVSGLRIFTDEIRQNPINVNKEYITGEAKQTYQLIKDYDKSTNFVHEFNVEDIYAWDEDDGDEVDGFVLDAPYTRDHTKVNDIVVQNPVSVESAAVVHRRDVDGGDYSYDTRADNELAGAQGLKDYIDGLDVCPGVAELCDFRILNCSYDTDKVLFSSNFEKTNTVDGNVIDTVYSKTDSDGINRTYVVNTTNSIYHYALPNGFNVSNDKLKYVYTSIDENSGVATTTEQWLPVFGDTNTDTTNPIGNNNYLKCFGTRWSIPLSDLELGTYNANTKLAVEFDFFMKDYSDSGTMIVSFNTYDFYIPSGSNLGTWNTGSGVEKQVKNTSFVGGKMHLKLLFDFDDVNNSELYINNEKLKSEQYRIVSESSDITRDKIGNYLNIGSWGNDGGYPASFYIDNLKIIKIAGDRFHTDACYKDIKQHEPAIQYTCQTLKTFSYNTATGGSPELYIIPNSGRYKVEAYGAQGGGTDNQAVGSHAGLGGYSYGFTHFDKGQKVLVYPGGSGSLSTGSSTEYFWVLTTGCGNSDAWIASSPETKSGVNYINSVTGKQELTNTTLHGKWSEYAPTGYACDNHSVSVAIDNSTSKMVSRVKQNGSGFGEGINAREYNYTGGVQTFTAPIAGDYTFEVYGAQGGADSKAGGNGGYSKGTYTLAEGQTINIYVGGAGTGGTSSGGGWNGGGNAGNYGSSGGGGGASDIRVGGLSFTNRVIVAGGGGGGGATSAGDAGGGPSSGNNATLGIGSNHTYQNVNVSGDCNCYHCGNTACGSNYCSNHRYACDANCGIAHPSKGSDGAGGGGGYHGGAARNGDEGGFGGSNYIGGVSGGTSQAGVKTGHGYVKITTPYIANVKFANSSSAGWNGGGAGGANGFGGGGATDIRILNYGGIYTLDDGMSEGTASEGLTFGPYIAAGKGHYQADIYGSKLNKCTFDAYTNLHSSSPYTITDIKVSDTHATIYFEVTEDLQEGSKGLEVRVRHTGVSGYRFDKMYISRLEDRIIVGGGGGGADNGGGTVGDGDDGSGGYGGGLVAGNAKVAGALTIPGKALTDKLQEQVNKIKDANGAWKAIDGIAMSGCGLGGGQNYGHGLGVGESFSYNTDTGGAGGGYYGGFVTNHNNGGAGGGSGYIDGMQNAASTGNSNPGSGFATIHMVAHEATGTVGNKLMASLDYTGNVQEFTAQVAGNYLFETWGAAGGDGRRVNTTDVVSESGGKGAYASGTKYLRAGETVYVYVGGKGGSSNAAAFSKGAGGWNGGGNGGTELSGESYPESGAGGGGATDIRTSRGSLASRFIVAAGGGGAGDHLPNSSSYGITGLQTMVKDGKTWARVLYQDISGNSNYFTTADMLNVNETGKFSCLNQLEKFRGYDGKFTFMLNYPDATGAFAGKANVWKQSSNPVTQQITNSGDSGTDAKGFEAISYPMSQNVYGKGIEFNGTSSVLDGAVSHSNWWLACGILNGSYGPTNTPSKPYTMPGPVIEGVGSQGVSKCELWVAVEDTLDSGASTGLWAGSFGGDGGSEVGLSKNLFNKGGTQSGRTLGLGAEGYSHNEGKNYGSYGGGGGGYYGGYWDSVNTDSVSQGGAGGSSYTGGVDEGVKVAGNATMTNPRSPQASNMVGNSYNGYARVWLKNESTSGHTSECTFINGLNNTHIHNRACLSETNRVLVSALNAEWGGDHTLLKYLLGESLFNKITNPSSVYTIGGFTSVDHKQLVFTDCVVKASGGNLITSNFGANPHVGTAVNIPSGAVSKIVMQVDIVGNATSVGELYWNTNKSNVRGAPNRVQANYDARNKQYVFEVGSNSAWTNTITQVSFDFIADNTAGGTATIKAIDFIGSGAVKTVPSTTTQLKAYSGFTPDSHHGVVDGGQGTTSFVGNYIQSAGNAQQLSGWEYKLPVNITNMQGLKFIRMQVINNSTSPIFGIAYDTNGNKGYTTASMIPNSNEIQEIVIPVNWSGNTDAIWFDPVPNNIYTGIVKVASIDLYGYGSLTSNEGTTTEARSIDFGYTGGVQTFTAPQNGSYKLEAWGASGGGHTASMVGQGGYTYGTTALVKGQMLYIHTGGQGQYYSNTETSANVPPATYNGGGDGGYNMGTKGWHLGGSGGGATDFRLTNGSWDTTAGLRSRILVAGGGGGCGCASGHNPGHGGGLIGVTTRNSSGTYAGASASGGSQTEPGRGIGTYSSRSTGSFGGGGNAAQCAAGAGGGYYGGGTEYTAGGSGGSSFVTGYSGCDTTYRGQQGGLNFNSVTLQQGGHTGNGKAKISYDATIYSPAKLTGASPAILSVGYASSIAGLDGTQEGIINAINYIANFIDEIPNSVGGEYNPIFNCDGLFNAHVCTDACNEETRVLDCQEPHHYGMHYTKATSEHNSCYNPCLDDSKHKSNNHQLIDVDGKHLEESIYINTDEYFSIFFPNVGDFYESELHGIGSTTETRGMSYEDQMQTSKWTREKYVKFSFDTLFYREETGLWEQYKAGTWIELPVKGEGYPYYNFYCTLNNSELAATNVEFSSEAINAKQSEGKYNYKNWQGLSTEDHDNTNADDFVYKNINGKDTASNHRNNSDNTTEETNKDRKSTLTSLHGAYRETYIDVVGRIGNLLITDTDDFRWCNMFKTPKNDGTWIVDGIIQEVIESKQNNYLSWHTNNGALAKDVRNRQVDKKEGMYNTWGTQLWKGGSNEAANALGLPLGSITSIANNPAALEKDLLKPGYNVNFEVTTTGNYQQYLQVKPYFYAMCIKDDGIHKAGEMYPVDVHMNTENGYRPINLFGATDDKKTWEEYGDSVYDYILSLNWDEEYIRRNYDATEQAVTEEMAKTYKVQNGDGEKQLPIPNGRYYALGTAQIVRAEGNARTFIGSEHTIREKFNASTSDNTNFDNLFNMTDYQYKAQRWHLKLGIPSSAVFTFYDEDTGERHNALDDITWNNKKMKAYEAVSGNGNYVIIMTANIKSLGETWNLYYTQADGDNDTANVTYDNGAIKLDGKTYTFDEYIGPKKINMSDTTLADLRKRVAGRTGKNINSAEVASLAQEEYNKILQERFKAQNRVVIGVYDASNTSHVDVDIIGTH